MFEEHKYEKLRKLGTELHIPIFEAFLKLEVFDRDGNLIQEHSQRSHSWVRNAYNMMFSQLAGAPCPDATFEAGKLSQKDTAGSIYSGNYTFGMIQTYTGGSPYCYSIEGTSLGYRAAASVDDYGVLIGTGTNAESFEDYVLQTPVVDGTSGGQISYITSQAHAVTYTGGTKVLKNDFIRYFNNNSGGAIGINEVGLACKTGRVNAPTGTTYTLMARDKLGATVTVADTGQLKTTYTIQITYPS